MKALSIHPYFAQAIATGQKIIEARTWRTDYRGDILICSSAKKYHGTIPGHALAVVKLVDVVPMKTKHLKDALMSPADFDRPYYAWILDDNRLIKPVPVKGKLSLWNADIVPEYIPFEEWVKTDNNDPGDAWIEKYWRPLMI